MADDIKINLSSRVFVANVPTDQITREEFQERFSKYGRVLDLFMKKGFAFVQYNTSQEAAAAIQGESGQVYKGKTLECSLAKRKPGEDKPGAASSTPAAAASSATPTSAKDYPPPPAGGGGAYDDYYRDRYRDYDPYGPYGRDYPPPRPRERSPLRDRERDRYDDRYRDAYDKYYRDDVRRDRYPDDRRDPYDSRLPPPPPRDRERDRDLRDRDMRDRDLRDRDLRDARDPRDARDARDARDPRDDPYYRDDPYRRDDPYYRDLERDRERDRLGLDRAAADRERERDRDPYKDGLSYRRDIRDTYSREKEGYDRRPPPASAPAAADYPPLASEKQPVDCEILVMNKQQRGYADMVERRLKSINITTAMMFLTPESSMTQVLDSATRSGSLYAVVVSSQHEIHRSVTLNILHGTPQEHRNMPLEDAMNLIARNFERYIQDLRDKRSQTATGSKPGGSQPGGSQPVVELTLTQLFSLLADGRQLTLGEVDRVIKFMQDMRYQMAQEQGLPATKPPEAAPAEAKTTQQEQAALQAKILSIIGPTASSAVTAVSTPAVVAAAATTGRPALLSTPQPLPVPNSKPVATPTSGSNNLNLDNPNVQKALDNLIQTGPNLLRNISAVPQSVAPAVVAVQPPVAPANVIPVQRPPQPGAVGAPADPVAYIQQQQIARAQAEALRTLQSMKQAPMPNIQMAAAGMMGAGALSQPQLNALHAQAMSYSMRGAPPPPMGPPPGRGQYS